MRKSTKGWLKAAVVTFGVVDCVGIYVAQNRLAQPVPADMGNDLAYALPADAGVFRPEFKPDRAMPALNSKAVAAPKAPPALARAVAPEAPVAARAPQFAVVAPVIAPLHRAAPAASSPGTVKLARTELARIELAPTQPARPFAAPKAAANGTTKQAAKAGGGLTQLAGLVPHRSHARLFADAFSGMANVPLDAPITVPLDDASSRTALAQDDGAADVQLAHSSAAAPANQDSGTSSAAALPEAGPAAILPDSDVL